MATALYGRAIVAAVFSHREASLLDPLAGLLNRKALEARFEELRQQAAQSGEWICVVMCGLDHFKAINDRYGHDRGDAVLKDAAAAMRQTMRSFDLIYRMGGEEFLVVLPGATVTDAAAHAESFARRSPTAARAGGVAGVGPKAAADRPRTPGRGSPNIRAAAGQATP